MRFRGGKGGPAVLVAKPTLSCDSRQRGPAVVGRAPRGGPDMPPSHDRRLAAAAPFSIDVPGGILKRIFKRVREHRRPRSPRGRLGPTASMPTGFRALSRIGTTTTIGVSRRRSSIVSAITSLPWKDGASTSFLSRARVRGRRRCCCSTAGPTRSRASCGLRNGSPIPSGSMDGRMTVSTW